MSGYGDGSVSGSGSGDGSGDGDGAGDVSRYGDGARCGHRSGAVSRSGDGSGDGSGYGYGYGYGYGDGYGSGEIQLPEKNAWRVVHYIKKSENGFALRDGRDVQIGDIVRHVGELVLCKSGFHSSFTDQEAIEYKPSPDAESTECLVWGRVIVGKDKLVSEYRKIIGVIKTGEHA